MKYFEYLYLAGAVALAMLLVQRIEVQDTWQNSMLILGIVVCSFMFSFRRTQRQRAERHDSSNEDPQ